MVSKKTRAEQQDTLIFLNILKDFYARIVQSDDERPVWEKVLEECRTQGIFMDKSAEYLAKKRWPASVGIVKKFTRMNSGPLSEKDQLIVQIERHRTPDFVYGRLDGDDRQNLPAVRAAADIRVENGNIDDAAPATSSSRLKEDATSEAPPSFGFSATARSTTTGFTGTSTPSKLNLGSSAPLFENITSSTTDSESPTSSGLTLGTPLSTQTSAPPTVGLGGTSVPPSTPVVGLGGITSASSTTSSAAAPSYELGGTSTLPQPASVNAMINEPNQDLRNRYYEFAIRAFNICSKLAEAKLQMMRPRITPSR